MPVRAGRRSTNAHLTPGEHDRGAPAATATVSVLLRRAARAAQRGGEQSRRQQPRGTDRRSALPRGAAAGRTPVGQEEDYGRQSNDVVTPAENSARTRTARRSSSRSSITFEARLPPVRVAAQALPGRSHACRRTHRPGDAQFLAVGTRKAGKKCNRRRALGGAGSDASGPRLTPEDAQNGTRTRSPIIFGGEGGTYHPATNHAIRR